MEGIPINKNQQQLSKMNYSNPSNKQASHFQSQQYPQTQNGNLKSNLQTLGGKSLEDEMLKTAVIELYVNLKHKIKQYTSNSSSTICQDNPNTTSSNLIQTLNIDEGTGTGASKIIQGDQSQLITSQNKAEVSEEERQRLSQLGNLVVIDYIRSSMDILLNLKVERAMAEDAHQKENERYLNSSRGGHDSNKQRKHQKLRDYNSDTVRSSARSETSGISNTEGPPEEYEKIIIGLEGDVRKHIRIEQQLKLHIESIEGRIDELEMEYNKLAQQLEAACIDKDAIEKQLITSTEQLEAQIQKLRQELADQESKHALENRSLQERFQLEREQLKSEITTLQTQNNLVLSNSSPSHMTKVMKRKGEGENGQKEVDRGSITNTTNNINITYQSHNIPQSSESDKTTTFCSHCRSLISPNRPHPFSQYVNEQISELTQPTPQGHSNSESKKQPRKGLRALGVNQNGNEIQNDSFDNLEKRYASFSGVAINECGLDGQAMESATSFPTFQGQSRNLGSAITNHSNLTDILPHPNNVQASGGSQVQIQNKKIFFKRGGAQISQNPLQQVRLCQCQCTSCIQAHPVHARDSEGAASGTTLTLHSTSSVTSKMASKQQIAQSQQQMFQNPQAQQHLTMQQKIQEILNASGPQFSGKERRSVENSFQKSSLNGSRNASNNKVKAATNNHIPNNLIFTQDQSDILKLQQEMNKMMVAERRQLSNSNKQRTVAKAASLNPQKLSNTSSFPITNNLLNLNQGTPDKTRNLNSAKGLMTSLTGHVSSSIQPQQSAKSSHARKAKSSGKNAQSTVFKKSSINQSSLPVHQNLSGGSFQVAPSYVEEDNPYLHNLVIGGQSTTSQTINKKLMSQSAVAKKYLTEQNGESYSMQNQAKNWLNANLNCGVEDHSSNSSLNQNDNSTVVLQHLQNRRHQVKEKNDFEIIDEDLKSGEFKFQDSHYNQKALQSLFQSMPNAVRNHNKQNLIIDDLHIETLGLQNENESSLIEQIQNMQRQTMLQNQNLSESMQNSHRRSRSQNVGGATSAQRQKSKSERRRDTIPTAQGSNIAKVSNNATGQQNSGAGRILISKNRITTGAKAQDQKLQNLADLNGAENGNLTKALRGMSRRDQSVKNSSSAQRESTPTRNRKIVSGSQSQMGQTIMNSEDRKKLFKTFMKEMNQSLTHTNVQSSANKRNSRALNQNLGTSQNLNDSFSGLRGISNSSSRPRSQLAQQPTHSSNTNYSSLVNQISAQQTQPQKLSSLNVNQTVQPSQQSLKFKLVPSQGNSQLQVSSNAGANNQTHQGQSQNLIGNYQSRNHTQISKIKDYYQNNTYNPHMLTNSTGNSQSQIQQLSNSFNSKVVSQFPNQTQILNQSFNYSSNQTNNVVSAPSTQGSNFLNQTANPATNSYQQQNKQMLKK